LTSLYKLVYMSSFDPINIIYFFCKTSYPNEEVGRTGPSPSVSVPWYPDIFCYFYYVKNYKIVNNSTTTGARENLSVN
jgi:hypothetical protein